MAVFCVVARAWSQEPDFSNFQAPRGLFSQGAKVTVEAEFTPAEGVRPALVFVTATVADGFHIFAVDQGVDAQGLGPSPTVISLRSSPQFKQLGPFQAVTPYKARIDKSVYKGLEIREHYGEAVWVAPIKIAAGVDPGDLHVEGQWKGEACSEFCVPTDVSFTASEGEGVPLPADFEYVKEMPVAAANIQVPFEVNGGIPAAAGSALSGTTYDLSQLRLNQQVEKRPLWYYLATAFLGGLILNIMPCVLPVIGLKIMSFVEQAGESRSQALVLNLWYSAGIIAVFLALAGFAVTLQIGWGDQFGNASFLITLTAVVFAMALSLLGLWEIPIPGFFGTGAAMNAAEREGPTAAFLKGILTTILATPCTGPFMVAGTTWAVQQPPLITFLVFGALGLGMASPYLVVGAFPELLRFFPKPGMWMETFKKAMGLLLLITVVWLLSTLDPPLVVPTIALMVGITAACWWIARTPLTDPISKRAFAWVQGGLLTAIAVIASYGWLYQQVMLPRYEKRLSDFAERIIGDHEMGIATDLGKIQNSDQLAKYIRQLIADVNYEGDKPWQQFSLEKLGRLVIDEHRTVLVDFTADWCASCKTFEQTALKTDDVEKAIAGSDVVTMVADYTKKPAWLRRTIRALGGIGVPVIAIFPADRPYEPIVFHGGYTKSGLLAGIAKATGALPAQQTAALPGEESGR